MRYKCDNCGDYFDEYDTVTLPTGVTDPTGYFKEMETRSVCPHCGSGNFREIAECLCCGVEESMNLSDYCVGCMAEMKLLIENEVFTAFKKKHSDVTKDTMWDMIYCLWEMYDRRNINV